MVSIAAPSAAQAPAGPPPAGADASDLPRRVEDFGDWRVLVAGAGEARSCYVTPKAAPTPREGHAKDRPLLYVTHRPGKNALYVVAYFAGYTIKSGSEVELDFGAGKFRLFTQAGSNGAWSPSAEVDARIVDAMKGAWSVTVRGTDAAGADVTDSFSLTGFSFALWRASQECQVR
jgi:invasion protein IalB